MNVLNAQVICPTIFVGVSWYLTGQPLVLFRFGMLWLACVMVAVLAQTIGNTAGAALSVEVSHDVIRWYLPV